MSSIYQGTKQLWPEWVRTIDKMRRHKTTVHAMCFKCQTRQLVTMSQLQAMELMLGGWYSLIDKTPRCRIILKDGNRCPGEIFFIARGRGGFMDLPLLTRSNRQ